MERQLSLKLLTTPLPQADSSSVFNAPLPIGLSKYGVDSLDAGSPHKSQDMPDHGMVFPSRRLSAPGTHARNDTSLSHSHIAPDRTPFTRRPTTTMATCSIEHTNPKFTEQRNIIQRTLPPHHTIIAASPWKCRIAASTSESEEESHSARMKTRQRQQRSQSTSNPYQSTYSVSLVKFRIAKRSWRKWRPRYMLEK